MALLQFLGKRANFALFLLFFSCSANCTDWCLERTLTCCQDFNSARLYHPACNASCGIEVEIACGHECKMYFNLFSLPLRYGDEIGFTLIIDDEEEEGRGVCLEGGQRIMLDEQTRDRIIMTLWDDKPVYIRLGRYSADLCPTGFRERYSDLMNQPL